MRVLHVYRTYFPDPPGGLQEAIRQICLGTKALGVESKILSLSPCPIPAEIESSEGTVIRSRSWMAPASCDLGAFDSFKRFRELSAWSDVIHYHFPWPFADVLNLVADRNKPKVMTYHSDIVRQKFLSLIYGPLMRYTLGVMDAVVATSPTYAKTSPVLNTAVAPDRLKVIPLGLEDRSHRESMEIGSSDILERLELGDRPFALALGVLRYYKGLHFLVDAASRTNATIVIAGSGPEGGHLQEQVLRQGVRNVVFAGQVSEQEKATLLRRCRLLVLPSHVRSEAFGMVLLEAAMFGKPMVCCEVGSGTSFVNVHGETGYVVPPENALELADAMNTLLADQCLSECMGLAARLRYEHMFSGEVLGRRYDDLYRGVLNSHRYA
ncbi:glycosyl transferase [Dechloromonas denitrificans]|uniref:Glycosyl transferase n=1 Tax=Dechloromonas denitrificans TaxID=281362 RepID=A0A133XGR9_9RHOO|nr:glycosyltransferase [Dechloromonas denitrificans]KXB30142.1 glycosyl transferase [Dechloromonas denitrificans]